jgi:hypothetical protein
MRDHRLAPGARDPRVHGHPVARLAGALLGALAWAAVIALIILVAGSVIVPLALALVAVDLSERRPGNSASSDRRTYPMH